VTYEFANNPDGGALESNPFSFAVDGANFIVADAAGNDLLLVEKKKVSTFAVLPRVGLNGDQAVAHTDYSNKKDKKKKKKENEYKRASKDSDVVYHSVDDTDDATVDAVPTGVALSSNGDIYLGQLTGASSQGFITGIATISKFNDNGRRTIVDRGFSTVVDVGFTTDGDLLVLENGLSKGGNGGIYRVDKYTKEITTVVTGLTFPTSLSVNGNVVYVTDQAVFASKPKPYGNGTGPSARILKIKL